MSIYQMLVTETSCYYVDIEAETEKEARIIYYTGEQEPQPYKEMTLETTIQEINIIDD